MRLTIITPALIALAGCNVTKDGNEVTVQYDQNTAENFAADAGDTAENIGDQIGNDAQVAANAINNEVAGDDDDKAGNANDNAAATNQQ